MVIGFSSWTSGLLGSSAWVVFQSERPEQDDQNRYRPDHSFHFVGVWPVRAILRIFIARAILRANPTAIKTAGITTIIIRPKAVRIKERCSSPICPFGSRSAESQPLSNTVPAINDIHPKLLLYFLSLIERPQFHGIWWRLKCMGILR